ncbi:MULTISPECIES: hypothetical protein [unclassified Prosthecochloris]|uniref:hypothetical protein n=1 Tax=unclassified Prosthecochloris TaxID=2632826 RepID=UPI00223DB3D9|nr:MULTISPECIES: hypothetical protein [unclassified Prosthecochloris]UZJ36633.1 hypothetical protein OO005_07630 [Prosthecochloris sp. SCSIO W1103]UZJ39571.1 hypothetical protein OO185_00275 [Prosthecochloris sp. SCSIO W1102]
MKKGTLFLVAALATTMGCQTAAPAQADVNVHIGFGGPRAIAYHPVYYGDYYYNAAYAPNLLYIPQLGFYASVGSPYDLLFFNNFYYVYHSGHWYNSHYYYGPWTVVKHNRLPYKIRKHRWHKIREYCNHEYRKSNKHRWLKHRHFVHKEKKKSIRNSAYYHSDRPAVNRWKKAPDRNVDYKNKKSYKARSKNENRTAYKVRSERERNKAYKIRTDTEKRFIRKEPGKTKTWRKNPDKKIVVKEKTVKTKRWTKQNNDRKEKRFAENRGNTKEQRQFKKTNRPKNELKRKVSERKVERTIKRWGRTND